MKAKDLVLQKKFEFYTGIPLFLDHRQGETD